MDDEYGKCVDPVLIFFSTNIILSKIFECLDRNLLEKADAVWV